MKPDQPAYRPGDVAYDLINQEHVVITEITGPVHDLGDTPRTHVITNYSNNQIGVTEDSQTVRVAYLSVGSKPTKEYMMPTERLVQPDLSDVTENRAQRVSDVALTGFVRDLFVAAGDAEECSVGLVGALCKQAGMDGELVDRITEEVQYVHV